MKAYKASMTKLYEKDERLEAMNLEGMIYPLQ